MNEQTIEEIENELTEEILTEINMSTLRPTTMVRGSLRVDRQSIFIVVPDTNLKIWDHIYDTGLLITNCQAIIAPTKRFTIGRKIFNSKIHQLDLKKHLLKREGPGRKLRVISTIPINLRNKKEKLTSSKPENSYYFYDASVYSQAVEYLTGKFSEKMLTGMIFREISALYSNLKSALPTSNIELLFLIKDQQGSFAEIFKSLHVSIPEKDFTALNLYDNFILATNMEKVILPLAYKQKGINKLHKPNITKFYNMIKAKEEANRISGESPIEDTESHEEVSSSRRNDFISRMVDSLKQSNLVTSVSDNGDVKIVI
jgi:hypothetical protein